MRLMSKWYYIIIRCTAGGINGETELYIVCGPAIGVKLQVVAIRVGPRGHRPGIQRPSAARHALIIQVQIIGAIGVRRATVNCCAMRSGTAMELETAEGEHP